MFKRTRAAASPTPGARRLSEELDLLEQIHAAGGEISFGAPTRCPACSAVGIVDRILNGVQCNGCLRCGAEWSFSAKAVALFEDAHRSSDQPQVVGSGVLLADLEPGTHWAHVTKERFVAMSETFERTDP